MKIMKVPYAIFLRGLILKERGNQKGIVLNLISAAITVNSPRVVGFPILVTSKSQSMSCLVKDNRNDLLGPHHSQSSALSCFCIPRVPTGFYKNSFHLPCKLIICLGFILLIHGIS